MALTERQAALVHLMTTPHTYTETLMRKVVELIMAAPRLEWADLAEVFLYGWNLRYRDEPENPEHYGMSDVELEQAGVTLSYLLETGSITTKDVAHAFRPAREVAQAIANDLDMLRSSGLVTQCTFMFSVGLQMSPYLGADEMPPTASVGEDFNRIAVLANPRLFALIHKGLMDLQSGKSSEFISAAEHIISKECTARYERMSVLAVLMYLAAKRGALVNLQQSQASEDFMNFGPLDPKKAN